MKEKKIEKIMFLVAIVVIAAAVVAICIMFGMKAAAKHKVEAATLTEEELKSDETANIGKYYISRTTDPDSEYGDFYLFMWEEGGTPYFQLYMTNQVMAYGTYKTDGNELDLNMQDSSGNDAGTLTFFSDADGENIYMKAGIYAGEVPEGKTFNASFTKYDNDGNEYTYEFKDDGTYTLTEIEAVEDGEEASDPITANGTYYRDGDTIVRTIINSETGEESQTAPYYIYNGHMCTNTYNAISEDEFTSDMEEMNNAE